MATHISISTNGHPSLLKGGRLLGLSYERKEIVPSNFNVSLSQIRSEAAGKFAASTGQRMHKPFIMIKEVDSASPLLMQANARYENLPVVKISLLAPETPGSGGHEVVASTITLTNATVSKVSRYTPEFGSKPSAEHDSSEMEMVEFTFQKIEFAAISGKSSTEHDWMGKP